ncbi:MAG: universal stress protein [Haloarculaceae archaeon]
MAKHILVPVDDSPLAEHALEYAATEHPEAELIVLHAIDAAEAAHTTTTGGVVPEYWEQWFEDQQDDAERLFDRARDIVGRDVETVTVTDNPARAVVQYAEDNDVNQIVMGSHGRQGVSRMLLGSVAETVVRRSPVPVTVVR